MLETLKSLDFLYQVAFSPRTSARGQRSDRGRLCKEIGWTEHPSPLMAREATKRALRQLSRSLTFQIGDPEIKPDITSAMAFTNPNIVGFGDGVKMNEVSEISGMASVFTLNERFIKMLKAHAGVSLWSGRMQRRLGTEAKGSLRSAQTYYGGWKEKDPAGGWRCHGD